MWITRVDLKNVKSHADSSAIVFARGVNAISGPTGSGKSTILEAIGFAIFDALDVTQAQFLREGQNRGEVAVTIIDSLDEREYQVVRPLGGGASYVYDPEIRRKIASGKGDVLDWLKEHVGVDPTADLKALFEDSVGVPQGLLTAPFLDRTAARKAKFDPLLQVDDYETAWTRLRETVRYLADEIEAQKQRIAGLEGELKRLPALKDEADEQRKVIAADAASLETTQGRLQEVAEEKAGFDDLQSQIEDLGRDVHTLETELEGLSRQIADAQAAVTQAQAARAVVDAASAGHAAYEAAQDAIAELERQRTARDDLKSRLAEAEATLSGLGGESRALERQLEAIAHAEAHLADLGPAVEEQKALESELETAKSQIAELEGVQRALASEEERQARIERHLEKVTKGLKQLAAHEIEHAEITEGIRRLESEKAALDLELRVIELERTQLEERRPLLEGAEGAPCPICHRPLEAHHVEELNAHYTEAMHALTAREEAARLEVERKVNARRDAERRRLALEEQIKALPRADRQVELEEELQAQVETVREWQTRVDSLAEPTKRAVELEARLAALGDPRTEWMRAKAESGGRQAVESALETTRAGLQESETVRSGIVAELEAFGELDTRITAERERLQEHAEDHRRYLENAQLAAGLEALKERHQALETERTAKDKLRQERLLALEKALASYDEERHQTLTEEYTSLGAERARLEARLEISRAQLSQFESEIAALQARQEVLEGAVGERERLESTSEALEFIRKTIREAGPHITRALVTSISAEADQTFGEVLNDHTMRLRWNEDYSITVEQGGAERDFSQLSGGEKTAAALAVRLALLHEMSQIRVAFFDEPTAHLDEQRRDNLAAQIVRIKGFNQLFVISHDDTFERETHHVLRVSKENGISQVEVS